MYFVEQKNELLTKTKRNRKWKIPHTILEKRTLSFSSYKNGKLKVKLWWAHERKKSAFFVPFILFEEICFNICALFQCIHFRIYILLHIPYLSKNIHTLFCLFLISSRAFSVLLRISHVSFHNSLRQKQSFAGVFQNRYS